MHEGFDFQTATASMTGPLGTVILLIVAGMLALGVELFIIPGFGVVGILGILALLAGIVSAWMEFGAFWGMITIVTTLTGSAAMIVFLLRSKMMRRRLILDAHLAPGGGTEAQDLSGLVGKEGTAASTLRPAGIALIENQRVDVVSEGGYIEQGTPIRVLEINGLRVIVARIK